MSLRYYLPDVNYIEAIQNTELPQHALDIGLGGEDGR